ncbi:MAG: class I SAM-dependent methyltransferase [Candidatus Delongbacteria bacterium]|nr:class I SAM-dependent methyltransferase [Candidatus Delongbacteria bacterium]
MSNWIYDEYKHCGVDYSDRNLADSYDQQHQSFRNYEKEFNEMIEFLGLKNTQNLSLIDLGCGTGATSFFAADKFKKVYGVDVSDVMIEQAQKKLDNTSNIDFIRGGFLSYDHKEEPVDLLITKAAFHHLPDFWKQIALFKMNKMIKVGGILYIHDIVFHFNALDYQNKINTWISGFEKVVNKEFIEEVKTHIRDEFSTFKWILDGMIEKAGFKIQNCRTNDEFVTEYYCIKLKDIIIE